MRAGAVWLERGGTSVRPSLFFRETGRVKKKRKADRYGFRYFFGLVDH